MTAPPKRIARRTGGTRIPGPRKKGGSKPATPRNQDNRRQDWTPSLTSSNSQPPPNVDPFDYYFSSNPFSIPTPNVFDGTLTATPSRSSPGTPSYDSSAASTPVPDALFDPQMWGDFGDATVFHSSAMFPHQASNRSSKSSKSSKSSRSSRSSSAHSPASSRRPSLPTVEETKSQEAVPPLVDVSPSEEAITPGFTNCLSELHRGMSLLKYPRRRGFPHFRHVELSKDNQWIQWYSKNKTLDSTRIPIDGIFEVVEGQNTETFLQYHEPTIEQASFSVVYGANGTNFNTFDVVAKSIEECNMWVLALRKLMSLMRSGVDVTVLEYMDVGVSFRDWKVVHRVESTGSVDRRVLKDTQREVRELQSKLKKCVRALNRRNILNCEEYERLAAVIAELEQRTADLVAQVQLTPGSKVTSRDLWRCDVDCTTSLEKMDVLTKQLDQYGRPK